MATPNRRDQTELLPKIMRAALEVLQTKILILYPMNRRDPIRTAAGGIQI